MKDEIGENINENEEDFALKHSLRKTLSLEIVWQPYKIYINKATCDILFECLLVIWRDSRI